MAKEAAFVHVERSNLLHVVVTHLKVEHVKVLSYALLCVDLASATILRCMSHRSTTCPTDLPYFLLIATSISIWKRLFLPSANGAHASGCTLFSSKYTTQVKRMGIEGVF